MKTIKNTSGVSLPLAIGLLLLLFIISVTASELVIRALRSARTIEASDKAYYAAEAGIEDALYELSNHAAGYTTPDLNDPDVRTADFTENVEWNSQWEIDSFGESTCDGFDDFNSIDEDFCGRLTRGQKVLISFYEDDRGPTSLLDNQIETDDEVITKIVPTTFRLQIHPPLDLGLSSLAIDTDQDGSANEDSTSDDNPDVEENIVILWKLIDEDGNTLTPLRGCIEDSTHPSHNGVNSSICEKDFVSQGSDIAAEINLNTEGARNSDSSASGTKTIQDFLNSVAANGKRVQLELQIIAPMEAYDNSTLTYKPIPFYEYGIDYSTTSNDLPDPFFTLRSDGIFRNFKQSIITKVLPETTTRLLDLTVIQQ